MPKRKQGLEKGYFKDLGQKYYIEAIKLYTKKSNNELGKLLKVSPTTISKILNQNTRNKANFRLSTFKKISKTINNIDKKTQFKIAVISKELKKVNNRGSAKTKENILKKANKELEKLIKKEGSKKLDELLGDNKKGYLYFRVLYGLLTQ